MSLLDFWGIDTLSMEAMLFKLILLPSEKWSTPRGSKFLAFRADLLSEEIDVQKSEQEVTEVVFFAKDGGNTNKYFHSP